jgi:ATP-dependent helicase Lhr and Lhr-like helicase
VAPSDPLSSFTPRVRAWFAAAFAAPTPAQAQAWPAIARGEHVLLSAPTGSGKTLAAFLWALDRLSAAPAEDGSPGTRVVYVSPLKALAYDIERNLRTPLRGIGAGGVSVGIRTGDTPQRERAAMLRNPPDILITTPESLYLLLTSRARETLSGVEAVIVDEIHAVAHSKRGAHLALTLERLEAQVAGSRTGSRTGAESRGGVLVDVPADALRGSAGAPEGGEIRGESGGMPEEGGEAWGDSGGAPGDGGGTPGNEGGVSGDETSSNDVNARARASARVNTLQRIGLSATQNPLQEIGRFLVGPHREVTILDAGVRKPLDLQIEVPVESMAEPDAQPPAAPGDPPRDPLEPVAGGESTRGSIWPAIYPELLRLVNEHNSTIVFVNNRRAAERIALRLNELANARTAGAEDEHPGSAAGSGAGRSDADGGRESAPPHEIARAHHGSLAREERTKVEELLKAGELPCLVATSSLELGIDMGAVDLVLQIESPKSVARGLQRIGRAGHGVGEVSRGRIFPKFRGDLLECAVLARRMHEGLIEPTVVPRNALDVLAQQIVAIAVAAEPDGVPVDDLHALVTSTYSYAELSRELLENVLDMLDGRYPSKEFGELRARIVWDRVAGVIRARRGSRQLAIANAGTIPDRGLYAVTLPDGRRVGELDEEMVYEARPGQAFLLGASTWRIEEIGRDRVIVTPAPGAPGAVPFWKGDSVGRPKELGEAIGAFSRWAVEQEPQALQRDYDLDERAARNLVDYLREQQAATRVLPSERTIVVERFRDEIGDWRICILSPYGGRVHAAWGLALSGRVHERFGLEADAIWSDDGIVLRLPDLDGGGLDGELDGGGGEVDGGESGGSARAAAESMAGGPPSLTELILIEPDEVERAVTAELGSSALFGARFRENAARALLIPRAYPGKRTPLWQQRLKAQNLLEVAQRYSDFPIVLETYRECLRDVLDVPGLEELLRGLSTREISLVEVETPTASPFAASLLFDYVATYMYEGDAPNAERRAAALSLDRDLLRELLGQEELRELIDPGALARVEADLQRRSQLTRATDRDGLHDVLRQLGDLSHEEVVQRVFDGVDADGLLAELRRERRAVRLRVGGEERYVAADEAGLYRDALGAVAPGGLPEAFLGDVPDALRVLVARYARTHGPFTTEEIRDRYRIDMSAVLRELERDGEIVRGELRPNSAQTSRPPSERVDQTIPADGREWCDVEVLRRLRRASLAALRKEIEPADARALAAFLPAWQGVDRDTGSRPPGGLSRSSAGVDRLREVLVPLQGLALPAEIWERDVLPRRTGAYSPTWMDSLCASGEVVWVGAGSLGRSSGRVALYFREDAPLIGPPSAPRPAGAASASAASAVEHELLRERLARGPCFFTDLLAELDLAGEALREALWDLVWAGEVTNDAWAPLRAPHLTLARGGRADGLGSPGRTGGGGLAGTSRTPRTTVGRSRFAGRAAIGRRGRTQSQVQGRWSLTGSLFGDPAARGSSVVADSTSSSSSSSSPFSIPSHSTRPEPPSSQPPLPSPERRRALAELLLERYGIVTREQVLAEGVRGGFALLYDAFSQLETLGVCRRGYFVEGMGGAQFALPGAVERLRAARSSAAGGQGAGTGSPADVTAGAGAVGHGRHASTLVLAAADPAQPYGAALPWPPRERREHGRRPARVAGAYLVMVQEEPVLYVERGGRGLITLGADTGAGRTDGVGEHVLLALRALAESVHAGQVGRLALERIDGEPAVGSRLESALVEYGFRTGPRRLTLSA